MGDARVLTCASPPVRIAARDHHGKGEWIMASEGSGTPVEESPTKEAPAWALAMTPEDRRAALAQASENWRYQDRLRWSRTQTLTAVEAALLLAAYGDTPFKLSAGLAFAAAILGSLVVLLISLIAAKDARDAWTHLNRVTPLERAIGLHPVVTSPFTFRFSLPVLGEFKIKGRDRIEITGHQLWLATVWLLTLFNLVVVAHRATEVW